MAHNHEGHSHNHTVTNVNNAFLIGIGLNVVFVIVEFVVGFSLSSLSLISDAGHNATDVLSLLLSLFAFRMLKVKATEKYTYGYKKVSILVSLLNAVLLIITTFFIFYEGIQRINAPVVLQGKSISIVAFIGIFINAISAFLFFREKDKDINVKGAYLHLLADALVSLGVVVAGIVIYYTNWFWLDTALSFIIGIIILISTWNLLTDSIRLALDGTPRNIDVQKVKDLISAFPGVSGIHHVHIWPISSSENAMTAHIVIREDDIMLFEKGKHELKHKLEHEKIHHTTFETEINECHDTECRHE
jgi:cobalt-zinc-cadmium efflux system protein